MKRLLFDQNLSPRLVDRLADAFPNSVHVEAAGLGSASDRAVWEFARENNLIIATKDADYSELGLLLGFPPQVIWIRRGNASTRNIEALLRENVEAISSLSDNAETGILTLF
jgi:predicted nuclease of predicted toxin-antitoxin system